MKQSNIKQKQYLISISIDKSFAQINQLIFCLKTNFLSIWNTTTTPHIAITYSWLVLNKLIYYCHMEFLPTKKDVIVLLCFVFQSIQANYIHIHL